MYKLLSLELDNVGRFENYRVEFKDSTTHLIGINGSGKSFTGLYGLWLAVKGMTETDKGGILGDRFQLIGKKKATADAKIEVLDTRHNKKVIISNRISKSGNNITIKAEKDYPVALDEEWLNNFLSVPFLSAKNFCLLNPKKQALLLGIDVSDYDIKIKALKSKYTDINAEYRAFGELTEPEKVEKYTDLTELEEFNKEQRERQRSIDNAENLLDRLGQEKKTALEDIEELEQKLIKAKETVKSIETRIQQGQEYIDKLPKPEDEKPIAEIQAENDKYNKYQEYVEDVKSKEAVKKRLDANKSEQKEIEDQKLKYMQSKKFGFQNLTVNEDGELLLNNREIREPNFSRGELEVICAKLHASVNPNFKFRFIDDLDLLDEKNQKLIINDLLEAGFQICTAEVGEKSKGDNYIVLKDCRIEGDSQEKLI